MTSFVAPSSRSRRVARHVGASTISAGGRGHVPALANATLNAPGRPLDPATRAVMERGLAHDFEAVRIHTDESAERSAFELGARAYTVGRDVAFGAGFYRPETRDGRALLAHELAHVVQQSQGGGVAGQSHETEAASAAATVASGGRAAIAGSAAIGVQREEATEEELRRFANAHTQAKPPSNLMSFGASGDDAARAWATAAKSAAPPSNAASSSAGTNAHTSPPKPRPDAWKETTPKDMAAIQAWVTAPKQAPGAATEKQSENISQLGSGEKLSRALEYARSSRDEEWNRAIEGLKSPQSIATIVFIAAAFIAAQAVPITWIADAALLAGLTVAGFFMGVSAANFVGDLVKFFGAVNAQTDGELRESGRALAEAVSLFGITAITGALTEGIGGAMKGPTSPLGPTPPGYADAFAPGVGIIRVPLETVPSDAPTIPPNLESRGGGAKTKPASESKPSAKKPAPKTGTKSSGDTETAKPGTGVAAGYRPEPTLRNAGWAERPSGGEAGAEYARKVTGGDKSLYVMGLQEGLGGTGFVELDGYRASDLTLIDAKDAGPKSFYDVSRAFEPKPDSFTTDFKVPTILKEAFRQGHAMEHCGAKAIEWHVPSEAVKVSLDRLFAEHGIRIKIVVTPK